MKRIYSICLIVFLCLFQVTPAFASVATSSDWTLDEDTATSSDWNYFTPFDWDAYETEFGISPYASNLPTVSNTVDRTGMRVYLSYYDMSNNVRYAVVRVDSSGHFTIYRPDDYASPIYLSFELESSALPQSGTYDFSFRFGSNTVLTYTKARLWFDKPMTNASLVQGYYDLTGNAFQQNSGDIYVSSVVQIGNTRNLQVLCHLSSLSFNISGDVYARFSLTSSSPSFTTGGSPQTSEDIQQDISNSAGQIADNTAAIDGTLKQLIQHISDQLHALWDQMYNYMHVPLVNNDNARTQRIIDRMDEGFEINVEVLDRNFHDLMANDDKNTDQITNGYDNSTFNSANSQLDSSVNQYDQAETGIFDSVKENVTGFTIPDFTSNVQVLTAVGFCSNYLQRLFNAIGLYNLPITVSLVMIFVLMVLGYYRVRS